MTETAKFFDGVQYTEADQADIQKRFRPTGILAEYAGQLALSAPGGMFVRIAPGEAMVEGFHYKNTANIDKPIGSNSSGSLRIDRVVLLLDRDGNTLGASVHAGTPAAGAPTLQQVEGGTYELLLGQVTVANGTLTITPDLVLNQPTFSSLYVPTSVSGSRNFLHNSSFRVDQLVRGAVNVTNLTIVDRWKSFVLGTNPGINMLVENIVTVDKPEIGSNNMLTMQKVDATALSADSVVCISQGIEGLNIQPILGNSVVLSFWVYSLKSGTYGVNVEQAGGTRRYLGTFTISALEVTSWQYKYIVVPWEPNGTWLETTAAGMFVTFVGYASGVRKAAVSNAWDNNDKYAAAAVTTPIAINGDYMHIAAPKLEIGTVPSRYQAPDLAEELQQAYRYQYVVRDFEFLAVRSTTNFFANTRFPVSMRFNPVFSTPTVPAITNGGAPSASNISIEANGAYLSGMTYSSWTTWFLDKQKASTLIASSTASAGAAGGDGYVYMGTNIKMLFDASI